MEDGKVAPKVVFDSSVLDFHVACEGQTLYSRGTDTLYSRGTDLLCL